ncbi:MAG: two-component system, chemotaxis family, protein-glutamate methylesterase/glutaminase [Thermotogaceae bacterium]|jgi:two-component system chemotaxis response regulator CheB|nr:two-component system, chemotaxis family, protein-glutamate methylesterase/glutaminase [Thermotogaceae bacterium]
MKKIRVLVVDDSAFMRMVLKDIIDNTPDMEVVGFGRDGLEAVEQAIKLKPDVITLDVEMPKLNGLEALKLIMNKQPTRVIMVSSLTEEGAAITMEALSMGACDFVTKPSGSISGDIRKLSNVLLEKIRSAMEIDPLKIKVRPKITRTPLKTSKTITNKLVVIASSTVGPRSLDQIIPRLPGNFPAPILIVQHMPKGFTRSLAERLNRNSELTVVEAEEGMEVQPHKVYVAPGELHLGVRLENSRVVTYLDSGPKINNVRPAADYTVDKAAEIYKEKTILVVLTGMGRDGTKGAFKVKHYGGKVIAESEETCVVFGMPKSVIKEGYADYVLPAYSIAEKLVEII